MIVELKHAISEVKENPSDPERVTAYWRAKLPDLFIPSCDWTAKEISRPMKDITGEDVPTVMVPATEEITLSALGRIFPDLMSQTVRGGITVIDTYQANYWVKLYASLKSPNYQVPRDLAEEFADDQGYFGTRERTYILASLATEDLNDYFLNQDGTWAWLLGSRIKGDIVIAGFLPEGNIVVTSTILDTPLRGGWCFEEFREDQRPHLLTLVELHAQNGLGEHRIS